MTEQLLSAPPAAAFTGLVLYCDGGARPTNPGWSGWGIHGYHYVATPVALKGFGQGDAYATSRGYKPKEKIKVFKAEEADKYHVALRGKELVPVVITNYVDALGAIGWESNNLAEVMAVFNGLKYALALEVFPQQLQILSDSKYTVQGVTEWMYGWAKNGWMKRDGTEVKNSTEWKKLKELAEQYTSRGGVLIVEHISAHVGHLGNEDADRMATMGLYQSMYKGVPSLWKVSPAEEYWKVDIDKHPFLYQKRCYFNTSLAHMNAAHAGGVYRYYLGDHGPEDEMLGKRDAEVGYSVVRLAKPEERIEALMKMQAAYSHHADAVYAVYLDTLFNPTVYKTMDRFGEVAIIKPLSYRLDIKYYNDQPLTREWKPPMLSRRAADAVDELDQLLTRFVDNDGAISINNVTGLFYDVIQKAIKPKKGETDIKYETSTKLKSSLAVGLAALQVPIKHPNSTTEQPLPDINVTLSTGIDIPDRNTFKRLEDLNPEVFVITWNTSDYAFRYATVIREGDNIGIWAGKDSNLRLVV